MNENSMSLQNSSTSKTLENTVLAGGYCVGCGACASIRNPSYEMKFSELGTYLPNPIEAKTANGTSQAENVCPFSDVAPNEDVHAARLYADNLGFDKQIGRYRAIYVGAATTNGFRERGSSGGLTNWILSKLLTTGRVDGVAGVGETGADSGPLFAYQIARTPEAINGFSKSKYYPVEISQIIAEIRATPGRYAIVVVPCIAKAIRNLCAQDELLASRIKFVVSIVCGHLKSAAFAESLAWQVGVEPSQLRKIDFRVKIENEPANRYAIRAEGLKNGQRINGGKQVFDLYGTDWGLGFFKLKACDYCDDIAGEVADITLGDAWLPEDVKDWRGTNILVVRNEEIQNLLANAVTHNEVVLRDASKADFVKSQAANYRHRHDGLQIRLKNKDAISEWHPNKRISYSNQSHTTKRRMMIESREEIARLSHDIFHLAKSREDLNILYSGMRLDIIKYYYFSNALTKYLVKSILVFIRKVRGG